jgi:hypothetical protein
MLCPEDAQTLAQFALGASWSARNPCKNYYKKTMQMRSHITNVDPGRSVPPRTSSSADNIMRRAIGKAGDIFVAVFCDEQNIMFTIATSTRLPVGNCQHRFH